MIIKNEKLAIQGGNQLGKNHTIFIPLTLVMREAVLKVMRSQHLSGFLLDLEIDF